MERVIPSKRLSLASVISVRHLWVFLSSHI
jgi:hypothetical protein